jgi:hypothetical protein
VVGQGKLLVRELWLSKKSSGASCFPLFASSRFYIAESFWSLICSFDQLINLGILWLRVHPILSVKIVDRYANGQISNRRGKFLGIHSYFIECIAKRPYVTGNPYSSVTKILGMDLL